MNMSVYFERTMKNAELWELLGLEPGDYKRYTQVVWT